MSATFHNKSGLKQSKGVALEAGPNINRAHLLGYQASSPRHWVVDVPVI
jgi:hypothetical protein